MPTLAINTSANFVSLALLDGLNLLAETDSRTDYQHRTAAATGLPAGHQDQLPPGYSQKRSKRGQQASRIFPPGASVMLAPMLQQLMSDNRLKFADLDLICLDNGPGMFTGLRVAVVAAKALAYASGADLVAVNTLAALAAQTFAGLDETDSAGTQSPVSVVTNAQRQQLFAGTYQQSSEWEVQPVGETAKAIEAGTENSQIKTRQQWLDQLDSQAIVTGNGLKPLLSEIAEKYPQVTVVPEDRWELKASSVGRFAWKRYQQGQRDDLFELSPAYFRPSAAEENRGKS